MDFSAHLPAYERDGFVVVRQLLPPDQFAELCREIERYIREIVPTLSEKDAFYEDRARPQTLKQLHRMSLDPYFAAYRRQPAWQALAEALIGEPAAAHEPEWFNKPPGANKITPSHQDNYYFCLQPPHVVTIWLALDPVDEENGCLRYVRGSHLDGIRPHGSSNVLGFSQGITDYGAADRERECPIVLEPGDAVAHHGNTIHRADANASPTRQRRAFAMVYQGHSCQRDAPSFARYQAALAEQRQQLGLTA